MGIGNKNRDNGGNESETISYLREPASIVENIILMGCPATVKAPTWKDIRSVVAGRLVNCYSGNDLMLSLMYRIKNPTTALLNPPVGISEVKECGVENFDVSDLINYYHRAVESTRRNKRGKGMRSRKFRCLRFNQLRPQRILSCCPRHARIGRLRSTGSVRA